MDCATETREVVSLGDLERCVVDMRGSEDNLPVGGSIVRSWSSVPSLVASSSESEDRYGEKGLRPIWVGTEWSDGSSATSVEDSHDSYYDSSDYAREEHLYESLDLPVAVGGDDIITLDEDEHVCENDGHKWSNTFCLQCGIGIGNQWIPIPTTNTTTTTYAHTTMSVRTKSRLLTVANITTLIINMILICVLIIMPCASGTTLEAFDCQNPSQIERRQKPQAPWCFSSSRQPEDMKVESQWTLLQRVSSFEIPGFRCSVYRSRSIFRCGMFSHLSLIRNP